MHNPYRECASLPAKIVTIKHREPWYHKYHTIDNGAGIMISGELVLFIGAASNIVAELIGLYIFVFGLVFMLTGRLS